MEDIYLHSLSDWSKPKLNYVMAVFIFHSCSFFLCFFQDFDHFFQQIFIKQLLVMDFLGAGDAPVNKM